jgi:hypothetical protein
MARPLDPNTTRMLSQRDLQGMFDKIEQANQAMRDLGKILARQNALRDRTTRESQEGQLRSLSRDQDQLLQDLKNLTDQRPK